MRVIHILRKPLSEGTVAANTLRHGTGGLNIGASRIGSDAGWSYPNGAGGNGFHGGVGRPADGSRVEPVVSRGGRWPANLILQHLEGCRCEGVKRVKPSNGSGRAGAGASGFQTSFVGGESKATGFTGGSVGEDGKEAVANWICVEGCPVRALDAQSGVVKGAVRQPTGKAVYPTDGAAVNWNPNSVRDTTVRGFGDTGGASRFYKQVGGSSETP
jgi:hypothetical protein